MKTIPILLGLVLLSAPIRADETADALAAFQKSARDAAGDQQLPAPMRETMKRIATFGADKGAGVSPVMLRTWLDDEANGWPPAVRQAMTNLADVLDRAATARLAGIESLTREFLDGVVQASDAGTLELLAGKAHAASQPGNAVYSESGQAALQKLGGVQRLIEGWQAVYTASSAGRPAEALRRLGSLASESRDLPSDVARKLHDKSRAMVRSLGVLPPDEAEKEIRAIVAQALAAESAKDLDPIVQSLRAKHDLWGSARELGSAESTDLAGRAAKFAASWQEYLAAKAAGNTDRVRSVLGILVSSDSDIPGVPRSMIVERSMAETTATAATSAAPFRGIPGMPDPGRIEQLVAACKTLADLDTKIPEIEAAQRNNPTGAIRGSAQVINELRGLNRAYQDAKVTAQPQVSVGLTASSESSVILSLRQQLIVFTVARQFASPALENDTPATYLRRRIVTAREAKDWRTMLHVLDAANTAGVRAQLCLPMDDTALANYLAGVNFEDAAVPRFAVAAYIAALQTGSDFIPLDDVRARLDKLRSDHAADYEEGLKVAASGGLPANAARKDAH